MLYQHVWNSPKHGEVPCNIQRKDGDEFVIRAPDPHDPGEVEFSVPVAEVSARDPE
jgi:hypothetical protein